MSRLCELYPGICLTTEEKARKNLCQGSRRMPFGTMKTEYTEQSIKIYRPDHRICRTEHNNDEDASFLEYDDVPSEIGRLSFCHFTTFVFNI